MKRPVFPLRARLALRHVDAAIAAGSLERISTICRHYLSTRLSHVNLPLHGADAHVAFWAAFAAMYYNDEREVKACLDMLPHQSKNKNEQQVRGAVELFAAALRGNLDPFVAPPKKKESPWVAFARVVAVEHGYDKLTPELVNQLRPSIKPAEFTSPALRARATVVSAILALCDGEPDEAVQRFVEIKDAPSPLIIALSEMARGDFNAVRAEWPELSRDEQTTALHYGVFLLGSIEAQKLQQLLNVLEGIAKGAPREALVALGVMKMAREGNTISALELANAELEKISGESPILACAAASSALMDGNASAALKALKKAAPNDPMALALHWIALAVAGNDVQISREIVRDALSLPADYGAPLSTVILAAFARSGTSVEGKLPAWLKPAEQDAKGHYAWGLVLLSRGAAADAVEAFARASKIDSSLQSLSDAPDVARLLAAKNHFATGDLAATKKMLAAVKSPRLEPLAERLELLTVLREATKDRKSPLDEQGLAVLVDKLAKGASNSKAIAGLRADLVCRRVRKLLRDGNVIEARTTKKDLSSIESPDAAFLMAAIDACDDQVPIAETAKNLESARNKTPDHSGLAVLSAEISATLQGNDAGIAILETSAAKTSDRLVAYALTDAYRRAHRGLDAKRAWFVGIKSAFNAASRDYAREIRQILEIESAPFSMRGQKVTRKAREAFMPFEGLLERMPLLINRTTAAMTRDPKLRGPLEAELEKLKIAMNAKDTAIALAAELEIVKIASAKWA